MRTIDVSVVYANAEDQWLIELTVNRGDSALDVLHASKIGERVPELADVDLQDLKIGVYSQTVTADYLMEEGDRLEIYRPLLADPKEVRRQLAALGKTMGKSL